jgi:outer membrane receptor protein involved in Fe transport
MESVFPLRKSRNSRIIGVSGTGDMKSGATLAILAATSLSSNATRADATPTAADRAAATSEASGTDSAAPYATLEEIVVTANKRPERQLDVADAITAFRGTELLDRGYTSIKDYLALTPGVQISQASGGGAPIIRGLTTGNNLGAIVGIVIDGAPIGPSSSFNLGGANSTDIDPIDLERVEVLKGPQGTLYGANTLGGLISYTFARPSLTTPTAFVRSEVSDTEHGATNYSVRAAASAPLVQNVLGVRLSGFLDRPSGFIDNEVAGLTNQNDQRNWGVNGSVRFEPTSQLSVILVGFQQRINQIAQDYALYDANGRPATGQLRYDNGLPDAYRKDTSAGVGTINYNLGFANLTSVTSYQKISASVLINTGAAYSATLPLLSLLGGSPVPTGTLVGNDAFGPIRKLTQELRLASSGDGTLQYTVGAFYTSEKAATGADVVGFSSDRAVIQTLNPALGFGVNDTYKEFAGFANLTCKISSAFDLTGGIRAGQIRQTYNQTFAGSDATAFNTLLFLSGLPAVPPDTGSTRGSETVETYLATARYHFSTDGMVYLRYATGFRPGGPNFAVPGLPARFKADSTDNFEGGVKTKFWDGRGSIDASGFVMNWDDILTQISSGGLNGYTNGGRARVYGAEGALSLQPLTGLTLAGTFAYNNGKITRVDPLASTAAGVGDPLPNAPRWSGSFSADYRVAMNNDATLVVGGVARRAGDRHTGLRSSTANVDYLLPGYTLFDVRAGVETSHVNVDLFIRNLTDQRAQLSGYVIADLTKVIVERPRTIGVAVTFKY